jgi:hypothetical protein
MLRAAITEDTAGARATVRHLFDAYVSRRSPWGPPWWIYGLAYGVLNLVRQAVILLAAADISTPARVVSRLATALVVIVGVNAVAFVHRRLAARPADDGSHAVTMARSERGPKEEAA